MTSATSARSTVVRQHLKKHTHDYLFAVLWLGIFLLNLVKVPSGFGGYDETFYTILPIRYLSGARLIVDEWNLAQFSTLINTPVVWLYGKLNGSWDGVLLFMRYAYLVFHSLCGVMVYRLLRKRGGLSASLAAALLMLFTPYDMMSLSYNTVGLDLMVLIFAYFCSTDTPSRVGAVVCGSLFGITVLGTPFLMLGFAGFAVYAAVRAIRQGKQDAFVRLFLYFTLGGCLVAAAVVTMLLIQSTPAQLIASLPAMLNDPAHGFGFQLTALVAELFRQTPPGTWQMFLAFVLLLAVMAVDRQRTRRKGIYLVVSAALTLGMIAIAIPFWPELHYHAMLPPFAMFGLAAYLLCERKPRQLQLMYLSGWVYAVCIHLSSNNGYYAFSMALMLSCVAAVFFTVQLIREGLDAFRQKDHNRFASLIAMTAGVLAVVLVFCSCGYIKRFHCYWDVSSAFCNRTVQRGPAKGLTSTDTSWNYSYYDALYYDMDDLRAMEPGKLLVIDRRSWLYLMAPMHQISTYSPWLTDTKDLTRLGEYYELNPQSYPDYVYIPVSGDSVPEDVISVIGGEWDIRENVLSYTLIRKKGN